MMWLGFDGINFRCNVWLNGRRVADAAKIAGSWRVFELDVTAVARPGAANALAVEVFPPLPGDLAITFVDWNPMPPDKDMGLWRDVWMSATGPVAMRYPSVTTKLPGDAADLKVRAELVKNASDGNGRSAPGSSGTPILPAGSSESPRKALVQVPVRVEHPRLWWPAHGAQELYPLDLRFESSGAYRTACTSISAFARATSRWTRRDTGCSGSTEETS